MFIIIEKQSEICIEAGSLRQQLEHMNYGTEWNNGTKSYGNGYGPIQDRITLEHRNSTA